MYNVLVSYRILYYPFITVYFEWKKSGKIGKICLDIHFLTESSSYSYELGQCFAPQQYIGKGMYTDKCCLGEGQEHILTCRTSESGGWSHTYLMIKDHWFCDDIVGYKSMSRIDVSGIRMYTQKNIGISSYDKFLTEVNNQTFRLLVGLIAPTTSVQTTGIFYCI